MEEGQHANSNRHASNGETGHAVGLGCWMWRWVRGAEVTWATGLKRPDGAE